MWFREAEEDWGCKDTFIGSRVLKLSWGWGCTMLPRVRAKATDFFICDSHCTAQPPASGIFF